MIDDWPEYLPESISEDQARRAGGFLARVGIVLLLAAIIGVAFWLSLQAFGVVSAIVYWVLFIVGLSFFPATINVFRQSMPNVVGTLHIVLMQVAFNHGYLVEFEDRYEWCPGDSDRVWIEGEWHDLEGTDNLTILGWRPFGIVRYKDDDTWKHARTDTKATRDGAAADGGAVERANIKGVMPSFDADVEDGTRGWWVVDLKRIYGRGVRKIGDTDLYERAEEVVERGELAGQKAHEEHPLLQVSLALIFGVAVSLVMVMI